MRKRGHVRIASRSGVRVPRSPWCAPSGNSDIVPGFARICGRPSPSRVQCCDAMKEPSSLVVEYVAGEKDGRPEHRCLLEPQGLVSRAMQQENRRIVGAYVGDAAGERGEVQVPFLVSEVSPRRATGHHAEVGCAGVGANHRDHCRDVRVVSERSRQRVSTFDQPQEQGQASA